MNGDRVFCTVAVGLGWTLLALLAGSAAYRAVPDPIVAAAIGLFAAPVVIVVVLSLGTVGLWLIETASGEEIA